MSEENASDGFLPKRLTIHKFVTWNRKVPENINFSGKLISISGVNGAGKSLIIDAITLSLFGYTSRANKKIKEVLFKNGFVEFEFEKNGHIWIAKRGRGSTETASYLSFSCDGVEFNSKTTDIQEKILSVLGMNYSTFKNTILIPQTGENFTDLTPVPRANTLKQIFKLGILDDALVIIKDDEKNISTKQEVKRKELDTIKNYVVDSAVLEKQKLDIEIKVKSTSEILKQVSGKIDKLDKDMELVNEEKDIYTSSVAKLESVVDSIKNEVSKLSNLKQPQVDTASEERAKQLPKYEQLLDKNTAVRNEIDKLTNNQYTLMRQLDAFTQESEKSLLKYKDLKVLSPEDADIKAKEILENYKINNTDYKLVVKELQPIIFTEFIQNLKDSANKKKESMNNEIKSLKEEIKKIETDNADLLKDSIQLLKTQIQYCRDAEKKANSYTLKLDMYHKQKKEYSDNITTLERSKEKLEAIVQGTEESYKKYEELDAQKSELLNQKNLLFGEIEKFRTLIDGIVEKIETNNKNMAKIEQLNKELSDLASDYGALNSLKSIFGEFQTHTLNYYLETLSHEATDLIVKMTAHRSGYDGLGNPRRYSSITFTSKKNGIDLLIDKREANSFSGGENAIIGMAIRVAISIMLARMQDMNSHSKALIIDEANIGAMDNDMAMMMIKMLCEAKSIFDKIIMITHKENILNNFDQFIEIDPEGGSHVANN